VGPHSAGCARGRPPPLELADVFREHGVAVTPRDADQARVVRAIVGCRTAALGGHVDECDRCGHRVVSYNSCRDRHCPKCQGLDQAVWLEEREADLLPVEYFHVVFTIPEELHPLFLDSLGPAYDILFAAVAETLQEVALNPKNLGAKIGFTALLHTWTQTLLYHPHIHAIVPGGGIAPDGDRFVRCPAGFFLPVRILSCVFRAKLLEKLERASHDGPMPAAPRATQALLRAAARKDFVVYAKPPFAGPEKALAYLARYTHRIAIANERLVSMSAGRVVFRWRDRAHGDRPKLMALDPGEFLRRFLRHVLPKGFVRIRHYGFLANGAKSKLLARCRALLAVPPALPEDLAAETETWQERLLRLTGKDVTRCPSCKRGRLVFLERLPPCALPRAATGPARPPP